MILTCTPAERALLDALENAGGEWPSAFSDSDGGQTIIRWPDRESYLVFVNARAAWVNEIRQRRDRDGQFDYASPRQPRSKP